MDSIESLAVDLGKLLDWLSAQVCTAESCTGGGIAEAITRVAGSSAWFEAGYVTYSNRQKQLQLGVSGRLLEAQGAVSQAVVEAMVEGAVLRSAARYGVAVSGVAGPAGGTPAQPVGTVWVAWADGRQIVSRCYHFKGDRQSVRQQTVQVALEGLIALCQGQSPKNG